MAKDRLDLHNELLDILGKSNVYFQPPENYKMNYPCIIYKLDDVEGVHANDRRYWKMKRYLITVVDRDPDTNTYDKILNLPYSAFEDHFVVDDLNHYMCSLYY